MSDYLYVMCRVEWYCSWENYDRQHQCSDGVERRGPFPTEEKAIQAGHPINPYHRRENFRVYTELKRIQP